jgi:hypothetical protein
VATKAGAKTCTIDPQTNRVLLITAERAPAPAPKNGEPPAGGKKGGRGGAMVPDSFTILAVGR